MPLDLETVLALHQLRQQTHTMGEDDLVGDAEEVACPTCGGLMFEDEREPFAFYCPDCDLTPH